MHGVNTERVELFVAALESDRYKQCRGYMRTNLLDRLVRWGYDKTLDQHSAEGWVRTTTAGLIDDMAAGVRAAAPLIERAAAQDLLELAYDAWVVIANAGGGTWSNEREEWQSAAIRWREQFHAANEKYGPPEFAREVTE